MVCFVLLVANGLLFSAFLLLTPSGWVGWTRGVTVDLKQVWDEIEMETIRHKTTLTGNDTETEEQRQKHRNETKGSSDRETQWRLEQNKNTIKHNHCH